MQVHTFSPMKFFTLNRKVDAVTEPVTLDEAKAHLRVTSTEEDDYITALITVARQAVEDQTRRSLVTQTWEVGFEGWPTFNEARRRAAQGFELPRPKTVSVTSVEYWDVNGDKHTMPADSYVVDINAFPAILNMKEATELPTLSPDLPAPVLVTYVAGFGGAAAVPAPIKHAILLMISHLFEVRAIVSTSAFVRIPDSIHALLSPYKLRLV